MAVAAERIRVTGTVQGVGFRPTVWRLAQECGVSGTVLNDGAGVLINAWGEQDALDQLAGRLQTELPPLSRIDSVTRAPLIESEAPTGFSIAPSVSDAIQTDIAADAATCDACLSDIFDPGNRRYRYPFTNCTHCGPRLSIVRELPYDRPKTSMAEFTMCETCGQEYEDPSDRRFHAQPNACPECGPRLWLELDGGEVIESDIFETADSLLSRGRILAIKGLGGFHLACCAADADAVETLRLRKQRPTKPFALMAKDIEMVRRYAYLSDIEADLLRSSEAPIVILQRRGNALPESVAPGQDSLGFMLPYTPMHHLLMEQRSAPLIMTSGNATGSPQCISNAVARSQLSSIADDFLLHNRDIVNRLDDSVARVIDAQPTLLRRARGYAPASIVLPEGFESADGIVAMGGELKNTFCMVNDGRAVMSQHIGDLDNADVLREAEQALNLYADLYAFRPATAVVDDHPDFSTTVARGIDAAAIETVQHHHAHVAACMIEHELGLDEERVLGVVLDGLGYGVDGELWGGEFLLADYRSFDRVGHIAPIALIGAERAMREPWRNTWAHLHAALGWEAVVTRWSDLELVQWLKQQSPATLIAMCERGINSPRASSAGRLFDAVAGALGLARARIGFEAEAAMALESLASDAIGGIRPEDEYRATVSQDALPSISWKPLWIAVLDDLQQGVANSVIAARFHCGFGRAIGALTLELASEHDVNTVVLTGGVFQNRWVRSLITSHVKSEGKRVLVPNLYPANDGGLSLGQAAIASARALI
ncbi:MAG: carbamoyltransferase HypF [Pseudomonadota bacterium]